MNNIKQKGPVSHVYNKIVIKQNLFTHPKAFEGHFQQLELHRSIGCPKIASLMQENSFISQKDENFLKLEILKLTNAENYNNFRQINLEQFQMGEKLGGQFWLNGTKTDPRGLKEKSWFLKKSRITPVPGTGVPLWQEKQRITTGSRAQTFGLGMNTFLFPESLKNVGIFEKKNQNPLIFQKYRRPLNSNCIQPQSCRRVEQAYRSNKQMIVRNRKFKKGRSEGKIGILQHFNFEKSFGFLKVEGDPLIKKDIFFHFRDLGRKDTPIQYLHGLQCQGIKLSFSIIKYKSKNGKDSLKAIHIRPIDIITVQPMAL